MVEQWGIYEVTLNGPDTGNPFTEVELTAEFKQGDRTFEPPWVLRRRRRLQNPIHAR